MNAIHVFILLIGSVAQLPATTGNPIPAHIQSQNYTGLHITDPVFVSATRVEDVTLDTCKFTFTSREPVRDLTLSNVDMRNCEFDELWIVASELSNVTLRDCRIGRLQVWDSTIANLEINHCTIERLDFANLRRATKLTISGGEIDTLSIDESRSVEGLVFFRAQVNTLALSRSTFYRPDFRDELLSAPNIRLREVSLVEPYITANLVEGLDIRRLIVPRKSLVLKQEIDVDERRFGRTKLKEGLREAWAVYSVLEQKFTAAGMGQQARWCTYRKGVVSRKLEDDRFARALNFIWDQEIRGHYGTSPWIVVRAGLIVLILFACLYAALGYTRLAWGALTPASAMGSELRTHVPRIICRQCSASFIGFLLLCFGFSLNQLLLIGTRAFSVGAVADSLRMRDWRYAKLGVGRFVGTLENLLGLALMVFFAQAFLRVL